MQHSNIPPTGIVGSLKKGTKFSADGGQVYEVAGHVVGLGVTLALHQGTGKVYEFPNSKIVEPHTSLLYQGGV